MDEFDNLMNQLPKLGKQLGRVTNKAGMIAMIEQLPDDVMGLMILGDFSGSCGHEVEPGAEPCDCGHIKQIGYYDLGEVNMQQRVYLLRATENCLFNR